MMYGALERLPAGHALPAAGRLEDAPQRAGADAYGDGEDGDNGSPSVLPWGEGRAVL